MNDYPGLGCGLRTLPNFSSSPFDSATCGDAQNSNSANDPLVEWCTGWDRPAASEFVQAQQWTPFSDVRTALEGIRFWELSADRWNQIDTADVISAACTLYQTVEPAEKSTVAGFFSAMMRQSVCTGEACEFGDGAARARDVAAIWQPFAVPRSDQWSIAALFPAALSDEGGEDFWKQNAAAFHAGCLSDSVALAAGNWAQLVSENNCERAAIVDVLEKIARGAWSDGLAVASAALTRAPGRVRFDLEEYRNICLVMAAANGVVLTRDAKALLQPAVYRMLYIPPSVTERLDPAAQITMMQFVMSFLTAQLRDAKQRPLAVAAIRENLSTFKLWMPIVAARRKQIVQSAPNDLEGALLPLYGALQALGEVLEHPAVRADVAKAADDTKFQNKYRAQVQAWAAGMTTAVLDLSANATDFDAKIRYERTPMAAFAARTVLGELPALVQGLPPAEQVAAMRWVAESLTLQLKNPKQRAAALDAVHANRLTFQHWMPPLAAARLDALLQQTVDAVRGAVLPIHATLQQLGAILRRSDVRAATPTEADRAAQEQYNHQMRAWAVAMIDVALDMTTLAIPSAPIVAERKEAYFEETAKAIDVLLASKSATEDIVSTPSPAVPLTDAQTNMLRDIAQDKLVAIWGADFHDNKQAMLAGVQHFAVRHGVWVDYSAIGPSDMVMLLDGSEDALSMFAKAEEQYFSGLTGKELKALVDGASNYLEYLVDDRRSKGVRVTPSREDILLNARVAGYQALLATASYVSVRNHPTEYFSVVEAGRGIYNMTKGDNKYADALRLSVLEDLHQYVAERAKTDPAALKELANAKRMLGWFLVEHGRILGKSDMVKGAELVARAKTIAKDLVALQEPGFYGERDGLYLRVKIARLQNNFKFKRWVWVLAGKYGDPKNGQNNVCGEVPPLPVADAESRALREITREGSRKLALLEQRQGHAAKNEGADALYWNEFSTAVMQYERALSPDSWEDGVVPEREDIANSLMTALIGDICTAQYEPHIACNKAKRILEIGRMATGAMGPNERRATLERLQRGAEFYCGTEEPAKPLPPRRAKAPEKIISKN